MLDGIDELDWSRWDHAYGPATDVPDTLRALASEDEEARENAEWALYGNLWHQGTVYEATQHAVPFLVDILENSPHADRDWILVYLAHLGNGSSYHDVHQHLSFYDDERDDAEFQARVREELSWVEAAAVAVAEGLPVYRRLLEDDDRDVRAAACYLLASLPLRPGTIVDALRTRLDDSDPVVRASAGFAVLWLGPEGAGELDSVVERLIGDDDPVVVWVGAILDVHLHAEESRDAAVDVLKGAIRDPEPLNETFAATPFADVDVLAQTTKALPLVGPQRVADAVDTVLAKLEETDGYSVLTIVEALLVIAFGTSPLEETPPFEELDPLQKETLRAIASSETAWTFNVNLAEMLRWWQLPDRAAELQAYCGVEVREGAQQFSAVGPGGNVVTASVSAEEE